MGRGIRSEPEEGVKEGRSVNIIFLSSHVFLSFVFLCNYQTRTKTTLKIIHFARKQRKNKKQQQNNTKTG